MTFSEKPINKQPILTAPLPGLRNVVPVPALVDRPTAMAEFRLNSAVFRAPGRFGPLPQARRWAGSAAKWQSSLATLPYQGKGQCGRVGRYYVTAIGRTARGINKAEDAGTAHGKISSSGALQRVFPTTASSYLQFRCWIRQDTWCNRMSVTFLNEAMRSVTRFYNISHRTIRNPGPTGNPRRLGVDRRSLSENCCDAIGSLNRPSKICPEG